MLKSSSNGSSVAQEDPRLGRLYSSATYDYTFDLTGLFKSGIHDARPGSQTVAATDVHGSKRSSICFSPRSQVSNLL